MTVLSLFVLLGLTGCKAVTTNVLVGDTALSLEPSDSDLDMTDLVGTWLMMQGDGGPATLTVEQLSSTTLLVSIANPDDPTEVETFQATPRTLGEAHYLLLEGLDEAGDASDEMQGRYQLAEFTLAQSGDLVIWGPHWDNFKTMIGDSFKITETNKEVLLEGTHEEINAFLEAHQDRFLFFYKQPFILHKVPVAPSTE